MNIEEILSEAKTDFEKLGHVQGTLAGLMLSTPKGDPMRAQLEQAYQYAMELSATILNANP